MYSGVSTYCTRSVVVMPAPVGIQVAPRIWIPASAGMTFHLYTKSLDERMTPLLTPALQDQPPGKTHARAAVETNKMRLSLGRKLREGSVIVLQD